MGRMKFHFIFRGNCLIRKGDVYWSEPLVFLRQLEKILVYNTWKFVISGLSLRSKFTGAAAMIIRHGDGTIAPNYQLEDSEYTLAVIGTNQHLITLDRPFNFKTSPNLLHLMDNLTVPTRISIRTISYIGELLTESRRHLNNVYRGGVFGQYEGVSGKYEVGGGGGGRRRGSVGKWWFQIVGSVVNKQRQSARLDKEIFLMYEGYLADSQPLTITPRQFGVYRQIFVDIQGQPGPGLAEQ